MHFQSLTSGTGSRSFSINGTAYSDFKRRLLSGFQAHEDQSAIQRVVDVPIALSQRAILTIKHATLGTVRFLDCAFCLKDVFDAIILKTRI